MKRVLTILAVLMVGSVLSNMTFAAEETPDATITMTQGQVPRALDGVGAMASCHSRAKIIHLKSRGFR